MSIYLYDKSLKEKLLKVFPNVIDCSQDKALEHGIDGNAEITFPMISFWRLNNNLSNEFLNITQYNRGRQSKNYETYNSVTNMEIPFNLTFQIDIWSDRRQEVDDIFTELILYFLQEPNLILHDDNLDVDYEFPMTITETNTDIDLTTFSDNGDIYRQVITIEIPNATIIFPTTKKLIKDFSLRMIAINKKGDVETDV